MRWARLPLVLGLAPAALPCNHGRSYLVFRAFFEWPRDDDDDDDDQEDDEADEVFFVAAFVFGAVAIS